MPFNLGALMPGAQTDMNAKIAQTLAGGQSSPNPDAPAPNASPTSATQAAPGQTPSPTYAPDPQNASTIQQLLQLHQRDSLMNGLSYDLRRIGASFGTAQQQASSMAALGAPPQEDTLSALGQIEKITKEQTDQNEHAQFMAGADLIGQQILGLKPGQGYQLALSGSLPEILQTHFTAMNPTDAIKDYNFARQALRDQGMPEDEINKRIPPEMIVNAIGGQDPGMRAFNQEWTRQRSLPANKGKSDAEILTEHPELADPLTFAGAKTQEGKTAAIAAEDKTNAKETFSSLDAQYSTAETNIEWLQAHKQAVIAAVKLGVSSPKVLQGMVATRMINQDTATARGYLDQLNDINFRAGLSNVKNVRSQSEANKVGGSVSNLDKAQNDDKTISDEVDRLANIIHSARGNLTAAAGKEVPYKYNGQIDDTYLKPTINGRPNPLYNGATMAKPPEDSGGAGSSAVPDFSKMSTADADAAYEKLDHGATFIDTDGVKKTKP